MSRFEIIAKDGMARIGKFQTEHGTVKTPLLMPVIHPGKSTIMPKEMVDEYKFQMVITNSYIIKSNEQFKKKALIDGVHGLIDFDGPIMTDSGTFQMYFHGLDKEEIDPLEIVRFQRDIGSDIGTILDAFSDPKVGKEKVEQDVNLSLERAMISTQEKGDMLLAGTVQGGIYPDLREVSAQAMSKLDFDVYPIGGVVPLMERYRYADIVRVVMASKKHLPLDRPVHLFGCGHPMLFAQAALLGCDFFDSASYAKFANAGRMLFTTGTKHLENLKELPCECPVCSQIDAQELKSQKKEERALHLMKHNLYVSAAEIRRVRQAISEGRLIELAAIRARSHPALFEAFHEMLKFYNQYVESDPVGGSSSIFYTGHETSQLPALRRFHEQVVERYPYRKTKQLFLVPDPANQPFTDTLGTLVRPMRETNPQDVLLFFVTPMGIVPWELEHVHPAQQCVFPASLDNHTITTLRNRLDEIITSVKAEHIFWVDRNNSTNSVVDILSTSQTIEKLDKVTDATDTISSLEKDGSNWILRKLHAIFSYQWGTVPQILDSSEIKIKFSRTTGKIRHIQLGNEILFTLVPTTGLLTPTYKGALELLKANIDDRYKVIMDDDVAEFVRKGKSALAKFVKSASSKLRAGEEVLVLDENDELLATGKSLLTGPEMMAFSRGVAISPRHSKKHSSSSRRN
ncbi:MAG: tRNA guanosine(15) transglycosylase TgtA [Candidatus Thorarchaeota archaeon]